MTIPNFRPADRITNPALFALARARWPDAQITADALRDIAALSGEPLYVPATSENVKAGLDEVAREARRAQRAPATAAAYQRMGFDPTADYHAKKD